MGDWQHEFSFLMSPLWFFFSLICNNCSATLYILMLLFITSCPLCIITTDHLPLEELHEAWLSGLPAPQECWGQEEPAVWVSVSDQCYILISFFPHYTHRYYLRIVWSLFIKVISEMNKLIENFTGYPGCIIKNGLSLYSCTRWGHSKPRQLPRGSTWWATKCSQPQPT